MLRVIRIQDVCSKLGISRTSLWRLSQSGDFPQPIPLGGRTVGFLEHEIDMWLEAQAASRLCPHAASDISRQSTNLPQTAKHTEARHD